MQLARGRVMNGRVELGDVALPEGTEVLVMVREEPITLTPEEESRIRLAVRDIEEGRWVDGWELLDRMRKQAG